MTSSITQSNSKWARGSTDPRMKRFRQKEYNLVTRANPMLSIPEAFLAIEGIGIPECETCGKSAVFVSLNLGFSRFCSNSCKDAYEVISPEHLRGKKAKDLSQGDLRKLWKVHGLSSSEVYLLCHPGSDACKVCGGHSRFVSMSEGFSGFCSISCSNKVKDFSRTPEKNLEIQEKRRKTTMERYGVENNLELVDLSGSSNPFSKINPKYEVNRKKRDGTMMERYGTTAPNIPSHIKNRNDLNDEFLNNNFVIDGKFDVDAACQYFNCGRTNFSKYDIPRRINKGEEWIYGIIGGIKNDRTLIRPLEIDVLNHDYKVGIEFDGLAYHSAGRSKASVFDNPKYRCNHLKKTEMVEEQGYQLFHVFENEYLDKTKRAIWESSLKAKVGLSEHRVYARKCRVGEITAKEAGTFCRKNHLQGSCNPAVSIGLHFENELVAVMTVGRPRFSKKYQYEILRFCSKLNHSVIGGFSKALKFFERTYQPRSIVSYANRRWSKGDVYGKNGFELSHVSPPNYFYFLPKHGVLLSRNQFQKHKLNSKLEKFDPDLSETDNMFMNGYRKIKDCGNLVYVKIYEGSAESE